MPYLKVPYSAQNPGQIATVEEVREALPPEMKGLSVDMDLYHPCVEFPANARSTDIERVRQSLLIQGFPAVY